MIQKAKAWAKAHPKTTKAIVTTVIVVTAISGAADEGASEAAIPEEEAGGWPMLKSVLRVPDARFVSVGLLGS